MDHLRMKYGVQHLRTGQLGTAKLKKKCHTQCGWMSPSSYVSFHWCDNQCTNEFGGCRYELAGMGSVEAEGTVEKVVEA